MACYVGEPLAPTKDLLGLVLSSNSCLFPDKSVSKTRFSVFLSFPVIKETKLLKNWGNKTLHSFPIIKS